MSIPCNDSFNPIHLTEITTEQDKEIKTFLELYNYRAVLKYYIQENSKRIGKVEKIRNNISQNLEDMEERSVRDESRSERASRKKYDEIRKVKEENSLIRKENP